MIEPIQTDDAFLDDVRRTADEIDDGFRTWWLGQSGFLVQWQGHHLLFDPYLSDSLTLKYATTDKPHTRLTRRVIEPARLDFLEVATSSHNHTDHLDADTLNPLLAANPDLRLIIPEANRGFVRERLGCRSDRLVGVDDGTEVRVGVFRFQGVAAAHNDIERDADGRCRFLGYIVRFGRWTVYHSGDTLWHEGLAERLVGQGIDLAYLPINGNKPERRVEGTLDGAEAVQLARETGIGTVVPCHFEMFGFNTETPELFLRTASATGQPVRVLRSGERFEVSGT
jgi:L-ascorbate metabolism protein UlaG (beta-lactamase superfamily)